MAQNYTPKGLGGLGIRDLNNLNRGLILKALWKLVSGHDAIWTEIVKAKYFPNSTLWDNARTTKCTRFWKAMMEERDTLKPHAIWLIGDGRQCHAFSQPWHAAWRQLKPQNKQEREVKVADFISSSQRAWDVSKLLLFFVGTLNVNILRQFPTPPTRHGEADRLVFTYARNRIFTLKKAYQLVHLPSHATTLIPKQIWETIWRCQLILPKIKIFLWKVFHDALPIGALWAAGTGGQVRLCEMCGMQPETVVHVLFKCEISRCTWFQSSLNIRTGAFRD